jgi:hypothetical protein
MEDADGLGIKRKMITAELEQCNDPDILDLIYKLLVFDNSKGGAV